MLVTANKSNLHADKLVSAECIRSLIRAIYVHLIS